MEEFAFLLDILPEGRPDSQRRFRRESIVYGIGSEEYKIFEMEPIKEASLSIGDKVYIGKDHDLRNQIESVKARVKYNDLTHTAQSELPFILDEIIQSQEEKFVQFSLLSRQLRFSKLFEYNTSESRPGPKPGPGRMNVTEEY